jgi:hypothetical protein
MGVAFRAKAVAVVRKLLFTMRRQYLIERLLLDIIRRFVDKNVPAVFCNTGKEKNPGLRKSGLLQKTRM